MEYSRAGCETPGPPGVSARGSVCTPSPSAVGVAGLASLSEGSLSPLPLICKRHKPFSTETSPSGLPPAAKMRAVVSQSIEPVDVALLGRSDCNSALQGAGIDEASEGEVLAEEVWDSGSATTADLDGVDGGGALGQEVVGEEFGGEVDSDSEVDKAPRAHDSHNQPMVTLDKAVVTPLYGQAGEQAVGGIYAPRLPQYVLTVLEKNMTGETAAERRAFARKFFSCSGAVVAVRHIRKGNVDQDEIEVEFATLAFLEKALLKEVASGIFPTRVVPSANSFGPTVTVKVLGIPLETSNQALQDAMIHHGSIRSVRLAPTLAGSGFIGWVVFHSALSGKNALEAAYGFLGKERIRIVHPAMTKELEASSTQVQLRLTNLPPNTTDWELRGIMADVNAVNWHVPRIPKQGMSHLRCRHAMVVFSSTEACQKASESHYQLRRHKLHWYHPSVITCYKCGEHGHFQASCPYLQKTNQSIQSGMRQEGVSYATIARSQHGQKQVTTSQPHLISPQIAQDVSSAAQFSITGSVYSARLDALEAQVELLSKGLQRLTCHFDDVTRAVTSVEQTVNAIASHLSVSLPTANVVKDVDSVGIGELGRSKSVRNEVYMPQEPIAAINKRAEADLKAVELSDHARITSIETSIIRLTQVMEAFSAHQQLLQSLTTPNLAAGQVSSSTTHPAQARVALSQL
jgi:hypothetical protein